MAPVPLLDVQDLQVHLNQGPADGQVQAVRGVSLQLAEHEILGLVGESGSGKSMLSLAIMGLLPPGGRRIAGQILLRGEALTALSPAALARRRGRSLAMVFQDPMTALNPYLTIGRQLTEVLEFHLGARPAAARLTAIAMLEQVGIQRAGQRLDDYPHVFSGGMRQRVLIAMALLCRPALLIADEPTTALDVTVQAEILALLRRLRTDLGSGIIFISHDLRVVAQLADRIAVMYAGRLVEVAPAGQLFATPAHPYTCGLQRAAPTLSGPRLARLLPIPGSPPDLSAPPPGCAFAPRCPRAQARCRVETPALVDQAEHHQVACWYPGTEAS